MNLCPDIEKTVFCNPPHALCANVPGPYTYDTFVTVTPNLPFPPTSTKSPSIPSWATTRGNPWCCTRVPGVLHLFISCIYSLCLYIPAESACPCVEIKIAVPHRSEGVRVTRTLYPRGRVSLRQVLSIAAVASRKGVGCVQRPGRAPCGPAHHSDGVWRPAWDVLGRRCVSA